MKATTTLSSLSERPRVAETKGFAWEVLLNWMPAARSDHFSLMRGWDSLVPGPEDGGTSPGTGPLPQQREKVQHVGQESEGIGGAITGHQQTVPRPLQGQYCFRRQREPGVSNNTEQQQQDLLSEDRGKGGKQRWQRNKTGQERGGEGGRRRWGGGAGAGRAGRRGVGEVRARGPGLQAPCSGVAQPTQSRKARTAVFLKSFWC